MKTDEKISRLRSINKRLPISECYILIDGFGATGVEISELKEAGDKDLVADMVSKVISKCFLLIKDKLSISEPFSAKSISDLREGVYAIERFISALYKLYGIDASFLEGYMAAKNKFNQVS